MADPIVNPAAAPTQGQPPAGGSATGAPPTEGQFVVPEKFKGKSIEDIAKAYADLESQYGKVSSEVGDYKKLGPANEVGQALDWARKQYQAVKSGKVIYVDESGQPATRATGNRAPEGAIPAAAPGQTPPWESTDFEFLPQREQYRQINSWNQAQMSGDFRKYVDDQAASLRQYAEEYTGNQARQMQVLIKTVDAALKSAGSKLSVEEILTKAAGQYARNPEDVIAELSQPRMTQEEQDAEINRRAEKLALEMRQKEANDALSLGVTRATPRPRLAATPKTRQDEDRTILESLAKNGIRF